MIEAADDLLAVPPALMYRRFLGWLRSPQPSATG